MDRGREGVVARLAGVDVVVGVYVGPGPRRRASRSPRWRSCWSWCPSRSGRRRSGTRRRARRRRPRRPRRRSPSAGRRRGRRARRSRVAAAALTRPSAWIRRGLDRRAADREVLHRPLGLGPPQRVARAPGPRPCCRARRGSRVAHAVDGTRALGDRLSTRSSHRSVECEARAVGCFGIAVPATGWSVSGHMGVLTAPAAQALDPVAIRSGSPGPSGQQWVPGLRRGRRDPQLRRVGGHGSGRRRPTHPDELQHRGRGAAEVPDLHRPG